MYLFEKENEIEEDRIEFKRKLNTERRKLRETQEGVNKSKDEFEKQKSAIIQEIMIKDDHISRLGKHLDDTKRDVLNSIHQSKDTFHSYL